MIRPALTLLAAGLLLSACGSISATSALQAWVSQSNLTSSLRVLASDVRHARMSLVKVHSSANDLHTVCGVLLVDAESANASLPTPDDQTTRLLSLGYTKLGDGANLCYRAGVSQQLRAQALGALTRGDSYLSEALARVVAAR